MMKQVIAVRTDLGMQKGKIAAQVGHACVLGAEIARKLHPEWFELWWSGQAKVVVRVSDLASLQELVKASEELGLPWSKVTDAGHTQIAPGTVTCVAVGPAPAEQVDRITGDLKLL